MGSSCGLLTPRNKEKELQEGHTECFHITYHTTLCTNQEMHFILEKGPALRLLLPGRAERYKGPLCRIRSQDELLQQRQYLPSSLNEIPQELCPLPSPI